MEEGIYEITPIGLVEKVRVASSSSLTTEVIQNSRFILMDDMLNSPNCPKLVSLVSTFNGLAIFVWEYCDDGIYRWKVNVDVTHDYLFRIEKKMKDGTSRHTDVSIIF